MKMKKIAACIAGLAFAARVAAESREASAARTAPSSTPRAPPSPPSTRRPSAAAARPAYAQVRDIHSSTCSLGTEPFALAALSVPAGISFNEVRARIHRLKSPAKSQPSLSHRLGLLLAEHIWHQI